VAWIRPEDHGLQVTTLLGESKFFHAEIKSIDLLHSSIVLEGTTPSPPARESDS